MAIESSLKNMVLVLFAVCFVASAALGGVYILTKEPIAAAEIAKINGSIAEVVPEFNNTPSEEILKIDNSNVYVARKDGDVVGYAIEASTSKGFSGNITIMVGFNTSGQIVKTSVLSHAETPGLGGKISNSEEPFIVQFEGKNPGDPNFKLAVKKDGGSVDAITASTITSRAFCDAIQTAYNVFCKVNTSGEAQE